MQPVTGQTKLSVKFHIFLQKAFNNHFNTTFILHIEKYSRKAIHLHGMLSSWKMDTWNITYKYTFHTSYFKVQIVVARKTLFWCQTEGSTSVGNGSSVTMVAWLWQRWSAEQYKGDKYCWCLMGTRDGEWKVWATQRAYPGNFVCQKLRTLAFLGPYPRVHYTVLGH